MVKIITISMVLLLSGCNIFAKRPDPIPEKVFITVPAECPAPPELERNPHLPIFDLTNVDKENPNKVGQSYVLSIKILQRKYTEALIILDGYRKQNDE